MMTLTRGLAQVIYIYRQDRHVHTHTCKLSRQLPRGVMTFIFKSAAVKCYFFVFHRQQTRFVLIQNHKELYYQVGLHIHGICFAFIYIMFIVFNIMRQSTKAAVPSAILIIRVPPLPLSLSFSFLFLSLSILSFTASLFLWLDFNWDCLVTQTAVSNYAHFTFYISFIMSSSALLALSTFGNAHSFVKSNSERVV